MVKDDQISRVIVTGSEGYIGSVLTPILVRMGFRVLGVDTGWFSRGALVPGSCPARLLATDIRDLERDDLCGADAIVHLAALSSDGAAELDPALTMEINHRATIRLAEMARSVGVRRFIFFSSCAVYDACGEQPVDESAPLDPRRILARSKMMAERDLLPLKTDSFSPVCLRPATAYGISPRQRFDVLLPSLAGSAWVHGEIRMRSDGSTDRPLVHLKDIVRAAVCCLSAPPESISGRRFNVGDTRANHQVRDVADAIHRQMPECEITSGRVTPAERGYRVRFDAIRRELPGFSAKWNLSDGITECLRTFEAIGLDERTFRSPAYTRLDELRQLIDKGRLGLDLRVRRNVAASA